MLVQPSLSACRGVPGIPTRQQAGLIVALGVLLLLLLVRFPLLAHCLPSLKLGYCLDSVLLRAGFPQSLGKLQVQGVVCIVGSDVPDGQPSRAQGCQQRQVTLNADKPLGG